MQPNPGTRSFIWLLLFPACVSGLLIKNQVPIGVWIYSFVFDLIPLIKESVLCQYCPVFIAIALYVVQFEMVMPLAVLLLFRIFLLSWAFVYPYEAEIILSRSVEFWLQNLQIAFCRVTRFTMLTLLTQEHGESFQFQDSSISFFNDLKFYHKIF